MRQSTAALIRHGDRLLFVRRPPGGDLGGLWELPGGKVDDGERPEEALLRELREELGVVGRVGDAVGEARFDHAGERF
ncbi:MAG: NUDIX domain-containing protein, partial [Spirochaetota bacterium]